MAQILRNGLGRLEVTTKVTLAVLALASGVYTYLGVRGLLQGSGAVIFFGAIIYSSAVSVGIYAFWSYLLRFMPHVSHWVDRQLLLLAMVVGSCMIIAMSSWLNAAALAGGAALEQHLANTTEAYQQRLDKAHGNALAAQSLLPDIELAAARFQRLSDEERASGSLTGTSGSGTVVQLLRQMSTQLTQLAEGVRANREQVDSLFRQGGRHLAQMRKIVSGSGPIEPRSNVYANEAVALAGVIASLQQTSIAPSVKRVALDLTAGFVAPAASGQSADLAARQTAVVSRVQKAVRVQAKGLAQAADDILQRDPAQPLRFTPLSTPEAVLLYAKDFLPSWAGAISIDLMPGVLILILCGVQGSIRRSEGGDIDAHLVTAADLMRAMRLYQTMQAGEEGSGSQPAAPAPATSQPATSQGAAETVVDRDTEQRSETATAEPAPSQVTKLSDITPRRG